MVSQVEPDSAAETAGLQPGDLIVSVDGRPVRGSAELRSQIGLKRVGRMIEINVLRDGEPLTLTATLRKGAQAAARGIGGALDRLSGAEIRDLGPGDPLYGEMSGVVITQLEPNSRAARSGLEAGDVIVAVNRVPVTSVTELRQELEKVDTALALTIQRGTARIFMVMR